MESNAQKYSHAPVHDVVVIGAGAAGLWAAATAAKRGLSVLLLEKTPRTGTKILASGGSRCNLTTTLTAPQAAALFGPKAARFLRPAFDNLTPVGVREHFAALGVPTVEAPLEKIFPESQRAKDVRDALQKDALDAGVTIAYESPVTALVKACAISPGATRWCLGVTGRDTIASFGVPGCGAEKVAEDSGFIFANHVFLCTGGESVPNSGTTGDGYAWLEKMGLQILPPVPALAALTSPDSWVHELSGIALEPCSAKLLDGKGKRIAERRRPVLFTHKGLSGPGAMDLSGHVARGLQLDPSARYTVHLDLIPDHSPEDLRGKLVDGAGQTGRPALGALLPVALPRRLLAAVALAAGLPESIIKRGELPNLTKSGRHDFISTLKALPVNIDGTGGFAHAEVTRGGLALKHVNPRTMEVNGWPGLYVFGELLDLDGPIGGLNFQSAFATAQLAGESVAVAPAHASEG
ncbi:MAG: aminoacetone oxidase family FAD-binding enzyme [Planctomycetota bacterium]|nr:aminoacetone oxidase family FAD-binding enzyme [Planctomycetota bacterium]